MAQTFFSEFGITIFYFCPPFCVKIACSLVVPIFSACNAIFKGSDRLICPSFFTVIQFGIQIASLAAPREERVSLGSPVYIAQDLESVKLVKGT